MITHAGATIVITGRPGAYGYRWWLPGQPPESGVPLFQSVWAAELKAQNVK